MSGLNAFFAQNVKKIENKSVIPSDRFTDEDGKPVPFQVCCITPKENKDLKKSCTRTVAVPGKKGQYTQEFDAFEYGVKIAVRCTVFPNLNDTELQNSWGVMGAHDLIQTMLSPGEFDNYVAAILEHNGFKDDGELVDEAKN